MKTHFLRAGFAAVVAAAGIFALGHVEGGDGPAQGLVVPAGNVVGGTPHAVAVEQGGASPFAGVSTVASGSVFASAGVSTDPAFVPLGQALDMLGSTPGFVLARSSTTSGYVGRTLVAGDIPSLPASQITSGQIAIAQGGTGAATTSQNFAFVGPTSGSGAPSFRALVAGDVPSLPASQITSGQLAVAQGGTGAATASANTFFMGPSSGSAAAPSFRALVNADLPAGDGNGLGTCQVITKSFTLASTGADASIYITNAPFAFTILDAFVLITTQQVTSVVTLRSTSGGGGNALSQAFNSSATGFVRNTSYLGVSSALPTVAQNGSLVIRASGGASGNVVGVMVILIQR